MRVYASLFQIEPSSVFGAYVGESEENLRRQFHKAQAMSSSQPCIVFFDEIDTLCPKRQERQTSESRLVAQMLTLLDGMGSNREVRAELVQTVEPLENP